MSGWAVPLRVSCPLSVAWRVCCGDYFLVRCFYLCLCLLCVGSMRLAVVLASLVAERWPVAVAVQMSVGVA